jgi:hypothetical protein
MKCKGLVWMAGMLGGAGRPFLSERGCVDDFHSHAIRARLCQYRICQVAIR